MSPQRPFRNYYKLLGETKETVLDIKKKRKREKERMKKNKF